MSNDDFEKQLGAAPFTRVPEAWRRDILQTANAIRQSDTPEKQHAGVSWWKNWLWPRPLAWGALASVWLLILASGLITAAADKNTAQGQSLAQNHAAASSFLEQRALLSQLLDSSRVAAPETPTPGRRSQRQVLDTPV
jgi:hypothetical protein